jgi:hypothetical protein
MDQYISVAPYLPGFGFKFPYIQSVKKRLSELSAGKVESGRVFSGPQCFRTVISKRTCVTVDTYEVVLGTYTEGKYGKITAELYDILAGKFEFSVYENESIPHPALKEIAYDPSYYENLELLQNISENTIKNIKALYKQNQIKAKIKSEDKWFTEQRKPVFLKALFKRGKEHLNATLLVKGESFKLIEKDNEEIGFSILVYSLGHKEHRLSYFLDGTTKIERNVHL